MSLPQANRQVRTPPIREPRRSGVSRTDVPTALTTPAASVATTTLVTATSTVTDPQRITDLTSALCTLPKFPAGVHNCPNDNGLTYHVDALGDAGRQTWRVEIHATGCPNVQGLRQARAVNTNLWGVLGQAMDVHPPTAKTFLGAQPHSTR